MLIKSLWAWVNMHQEAELLSWLHLWMSQKLFWPLLREKVPQFSCPQLCLTQCALIVIVVLCSSLVSIIQPNAHVHRTDLPCPRGRWGHKTCGPCNCQTDKGFDFDCNKTSGECRCKVRAAAFNSLLYNTLTTYCRPYTNVIFQWTVVLHRIIAN